MNIGAAQRLCTCGMKFRSDSESTDIRDTMRPVPTDDIDSFDRRRHLSYTEAISFDLILFPRRIILCG